MPKSAGVPEAAGSKLREKVAMRIPSGDEDAIIQVSHPSKTFPAGKAALDHVSLEIKRSETFALLYPAAPVATPLDLAELKHSDMHPKRYTVKNLFRRLAQKDDPWDGKLGKQQPVGQD